MATNKYHPNVCVQSRVEQLTIQFPKSLGERERETTRFYVLQHIRHSAHICLWTVCSSLFFSLYKNVKNGDLNAQSVRYSRPYTESKKSLIDDLNLFLLRDDCQIKENKCCIVPHLFSCRVRENGN